MRSIVLLLAVAVSLGACGAPEGDVPSAEGSYILDVHRHTATLYVREVQRQRVALAALDEKERGVVLDDLLRQARKRSSELEVRLRLEPGGAFFVRYRDGKRHVEDRGTWTQRGEQIELVTAGLAGDNGPRTDIVRARLEEGCIHLDEWPVPLPFVLVRE